jgi:ABC-type lipoprotein release transport system permease subunit
MLVMRQGVCVGLLVGVAAALAAGEWIRSFLFGTEAYDPAAISAVVLLLLLVTALACWAPARRASRIDPMTALRNN